MPFLSPNQQRLGITDSVYCITWPYHSPDTVLLNNTTLFSVKTTEKPHWSGRYETLTQPLTYETRKVFIKLNSKADKCWNNSAQPWNQTFEDTSDISYKQAKFYSLSIKNTSTKFIWKLYVALLTCRNVWLTSWTYDGTTACLSHDGSRISQQFQEKAQLDATRNFLSYTTNTTITLKRINTNL